MKHLLVQDWMTRDVTTIAPDTKLPDAAAIMRKNHIRRLPVVDETGILIGILSYSDVLSAEPSGATSLDVWELNYLLSKLRVEKVMTRNPFTVRPESSLREAAQLMYEHKIGGIPVVDEAGRVAGIITESDIFRILIAWLNEDVTESETPGR